MPLLVQVCSIVEENFPAKKQKNREKVWHDFCYVRASSYVPSFWEEGAKNS